MQVLKGGNLVPSSMNPGNTTSGNPELAMTAPGSQSVLPVPENPDVLPQPRFSNDAPMPVGHPGQQKHTAASGGNAGGGSYHTISISGEWKELD